MIYGIWAIRISVLLEFIKQSVIDCKDILDLLFDNGSFKTVLDVGIW
jgi:hypothetical protein